MVVEEEGVEEVVVVSIEVVEVIMVTVKVEKC